ncbi:MAG: FAD-dependent oxidoreductase [Candidatus Aminicenantes bacterium]|nr:FAD-dependent oxidoreductase [Candidatus Aminicenantes bacterium]
MSHDWREDTRSEYDVIVIGSGLAGLTCANMLARGGYSVLLIEQHYNLGGLATWFKRKGGHIFDISLHGFPVGMIKTCRKYWSPEIADSIVQLKGIRLDNPQFSLTTTYDSDDFKRILQERFKITGETTDDFISTIRGMNFYDDQNLTTRQLFERFFPGRDDVMRMIMEPITYANGSTLDDPAITYGIVFSNFLNKGVYTVQGGTDQFIGKMREELLKNGVAIRTKCLVEKIVIQEGKTESKKTAGVIANGKRIKSKAVVSNGNLLSTIHKLVGDEHFSPSFVAEARKVRLNNSTCQVYIGIKKGEEIPYIGDLLFTSEAEKFDTQELRSKNTTSRALSIYYPQTRPGSDMYSIVACYNANYEDWANLSEGEYLTSKEELIQRTLDALGKYVPKIRDKVDHLEASTPKTFQRYTLHLSGASFGTKFEGLKVSMGLPKEIPGLFHTGSVGIIMSGWLGTTNYGVIVAHDVDKFLSAGARNA